MNTPLYFERFTHEPLVEGAPAPFTTQRSLTSGPLRAAPLLIPISGVEFFAMLCELRGHGSVQLFLARTQHTEPFPSELLSLPHGEQVIGEL